MFWYIDPVYLWYVFIPALLISLGKAILAFGIMFAVGHWALRPILGWVTSSYSVELFTLAILLLSLAAAWATYQMGLSLALGAFLAGELSLESVPRAQREILTLTNAAGKISITATEMLESMISSPRPTRAEVTDVYRSVLDGTDAVMLSEETATGRYPVAAVHYMTNIIRAAEEQFPYQRYRNKLQDLDISQSVAAAACSLADNLNAAAIVATTRSGATARHVARFRPRGLIIALSPSEKTVRRLAMCWGCIPCYLQLTDDTDEIIEKAAESALKTGHVKAGDVVVITGGRPLYAAGTTNMLWVKRL